MPPSATEVVTHPTNGQAPPPLPRSASYTHPITSSTESRPTDLRRTFSDVSSAPSNEHLSKETVATGKDILRRTSFNSDDRPTIGHVPKSSYSTTDLVGKGNAVSYDESLRYPETRPPEPVARPAKGRSMPGKLASLARKPWTSNSRPRSPSVRSEEKASTGPPVNHTRTPSQTDGLAVPATDTTGETKKKAVLYKRPRRPTLAIVADGCADSTSPTTPTSPSPSLRSKSSFSKFTIQPNVSTPVLPPMPRSASANASFNSSGNPTPDTSRNRDELWGTFRILDADYQKFQSKSSALKGDVIRSSLTPFLARHSQDSCANLKPEDLDRRVNILDKWWTGMLEMLNGKNNQSISGIDRPVFLEAVIGIMTRPEWKVPFPSPHSNASSSSSRQHSASVSEKSDASSSSSDFLVTSIHHNIRNVFVQNLLSQMAFVVERMSTRNAPASLVSFCGKACAYAFFYCPGVADILTRLWNTPPECFRNVLEESDIHRNTNMRLYSQELALNFPMSLRTLTFQTYASFMRYLRRGPEVPLNTSQITWQGPWISRWCGRDTDLFFVFAKHVHILYADCLPADTEKSKRILAPGLLPIHAQLLAVLEDTLYKPLNPMSLSNSHAPSSVTFEDFIEGADASVSALPLGSSNGLHPMADNRLIILLRDFLSESSAEPGPARLLYAESFCSVTKAEIRKTSLFNHGACFMLCDFVEEIVPILARYSQSIGVELFDWDFWLEVCRQMMQSQNSMTEIRVFSLLFCLWDSCVGTEERKAKFCLGFLLQEPFFYTYFSHWSSMVRAYFQRLLCWRLARFPEGPTLLDTTIYETILDRLQQVYTYYLEYQCKAGDEGIALLSSAPCAPAPGRRIVIIRCDNQPPPTTNLPISFNRFGASTTPEQSTATRSQTLPKNEPPTPDTQSTSRRRWNLFKSVFSSSTSSKSDDRVTNGNAGDAVVNGSAGAPVKTPDDKSRAQNASDEQLRLKTPRQSFSFRFSLEWMERPQWLNQNRRLTTPCLPRASHILMQRQQSMAGSDQYYETASEYASERNSDETARNCDGSQSKANADGATEARDTDSSTTSPEGETGARDPSPASNIAASKYAGRALAEWALIVLECDSFYARRRDEGVPSDQLVETPTLSVDPPRK